MRKGLFCCLAVLLWMGMLMSRGSKSPSSNQVTSAEAVAAATAALTIGYAAGDSASGVTQNLTLPATGIDSSTIVWASSAATVVSTAGVVTRPNIGNANVTLTATITAGSASDTKDFAITVKAQLTDARAVVIEVSNGSTGGKWVTGTQPDPRRLVVSPGIRDRST